VQYPYKIDSVTVTPFTLPASGNALVIISGNNTACADYQGFDPNTDAGFDNLDLGDLHNNSYCRQDWYISDVFEAYVQTAEGDCDENQVSPPCPLVYPPFLLLTDTDT
jgi:hypothetical protein